MKFNELLTGLDEKKEQLTEAVSETSLKEQGIEFLEHLQESDYMEDVYNNHSLLTQDDYWDAIICEFSKEKEVDVTDEEKDKIRNAICEFISVKLELSECAIGMCNDIVHEINDCPYLPEPIDGFWFDDSMTHILFDVKTDDTLEIKYVIPMEILSEKDYINAAQDCFYSDFVNAQIETYESFLQDVFGDSGYQFNVFLNTNDLSPVICFMFTDNVWNSEEDKMLDFSYDLDKFLSTDVVGFCTELRDYLSKENSMMELIKDQCLDKIETVITADASKMEIETPGDIDDISDLTELAGEIAEKLDFDDAD